MLKCIIYFQEHATCVILATRPLCAMNALMMAAGSALASVGPDWKHVCDAALCGISRNSWGGHQGVMKEIGHEQDLKGRYQSGGIPGNFVCIQNVRKYCFHEAIVWRSITGYILLLFTSTNESSRCFQDGFTWAISPCAASFKCMDPSV